MEDKWIEVDSFLGTLRWKVYILEKDFEIWSGISYALGMMENGGFVLVTSLTSHPFISIGQSGVGY